MAPTRRPVVQLAGSTADALAWVSGLVLCLSSFMGWYSLGGQYITGSILGWHTGSIGKLVFFLGLAVLAVLLLDATGVELPPSVPAGLIVSGLGVVSTILVLIRLIDIPDRFAGSGRAIGIWIALAAALLVVTAGLARAGEQTERES